MDKNLEQYIIHMAPYMFRYTGWDDKTESMMSYGFCCGDGWFDLIEELVSELKVLDIHKDVRVFQVKEKLGSLRFYLNGGVSQEIRDAITRAESKSETICELCGAPSKIRTYAHWKYNACKPCFKKIDKRNIIHKSVEGICRFVIRHYYNLKYYVRRNEDV